jgi:hypothetical protein
MGLFLSLDDVNHVLFIRFEGVVTDQVLLTRYQQAREWMANHGPISSVTDFTDVTSFEVTAQGVNLLAANSPLVPDGFLRVVVAPQDEVYGMSRMFEMMGSLTRNRVDIVRTMAEAYAVTGITKPQPLPILKW